MYNFKDPLLSHITDRSCIFQECPMYLPWDMTKGLSGYGESTKCMTGSSVLMSLLSPRPQILHYHLHSSQALWPANLDTMLQEPPQRFPGHRSAHGPRKTLWLMRLHSWVWRALLPPPAVSGASDTDLVSFCAILPPLRIWHHQYFLNGTMQHIKGQEEIWVPMSLFNK